MSAILEGTPDKRLALVTGRAYRAQADDTARYLGTQVLETTAYDFANGEGWMFIQGSWTLPSFLSANPDFNVEFTILPNESGKPIAVESADTGFCVNAKIADDEEKMEAIDAFHPARMADRILGMGDIVSLVERAQEQFDEEEAKRLQRKIQKNKFDFNDFLGQIQQIKKMGNIKDLASMIPGVGKAIKDIDIDDNAFKGIEAIILSMTPKERTNPEILNTSRRARIAKGSGTTVQDVNRLIKQFDQTRKMMKMVTGSKMSQMMSAMKGMRNMPKM